MRINYQYGDTLIPLKIDAEAEGWRVVLPDGSTHRITARFLPDDVLEISEEQGAGAVTFRVPFARRDRHIALSLNGQPYLFQPAGSMRPSTASRVASGALIAPMAGTVIDVKVQEGDSVEAYQPLAVVEAMKVMATLDAPFAGVVTKVYVGPSQQVAHGAPILDIAPRAVSEEDSETP